MLENLHSGAAPATKTMQRAIGRAEVVFDRNGLRHLYQSGSAKILLPKTYGTAPLAVFINSAGGVTGGDSFSYSASVNEGASLCATSQAAERIYRASSGVARIKTSLTVGKNAILEWLPLETILFEGASLSRTIVANLEKDARLLLLETIILGRSAMGEILENVSFSDQWLISRNGRLIFADALRLFAPLSTSTGNIAALGPNSSLANLLYIGSDARQRLKMVRSLLRFEGIKAAASAWDDILTVRFLSESPKDLKLALNRFLIRFRGCELPRTWYM